MEGEVIIKSIHVDNPKGIKRVRVKYTVNKSNVQKTIELAVKHTKEQKDIVMFLKQHYPNHNIKGLESWRLQ